MNWLKQTADTLAIITVVLICFWSLNEKLSEVSQKVKSLELDMSVVKTLLFMKNVMPVE